MRATAETTITLLIDRIRTPIGTMLLVADEDGSLCAADFHDYEPRMLRLLRQHYAAEGGRTLRKAPVAAIIRDHVDAYFNGDLAALTRIKVKTGGTDFQRRVWTALREITPGRTETYATLAQRIGRPAAVRAVGAANGANPVSIVVPCHRLIGADGGLTGYGGGIERKHWLLTHEGAAFKGSSIRGPLRP
ncbi:methylated-DNA--[protein]-cysteine S-methyltransferase [Afipia sp. P52-10]|uniref:methylated-DNA--[protein]-cysteine S-methyltransferase n=1 Tax=Afipia sp. P52-10 TaxID=1429916 RepID=UPI0004B2E3FA|nr:methylated-DNA--[protein]-cysteine S-methyltransferase [Afipia sp. P52-10]